MYSLYKLNHLVCFLCFKGTFSDSESEDERDGNIFEKQGYILRVSTEIIIFIIYNNLPCTSEIYLMFSKKMFKLKH